MLDKRVIFQKIDVPGFYKSFIPSLKINGKADIMGHCPFHDDKHPSLSVNIQKGLYNCFSCGESGDVFTFYQKLKKVNFMTALEEIAAMQGIAKEVKSRVVATSYYKNTEGKILYRKERLQPGRNGRLKEFFFHHPENSKWVKGRGYDPVLYNLPEVNKSRYAFIVEGEAKADLLMSWGLIATCLDSGSNSPWRDEYFKSFEGKEKVVLLPDNDIPGQSYALRITEAIYGKVGSIKIVNLPRLKETEDIVDWANAGGTKDKLLEIVSATDDWKPNSEIEYVEKLSDPIPFDDHSLLPNFPCDALPDIGKEIVETVSEINQVDVSLTASIYLAVLSCALSRKVKVDLTTHREPVNIYTVSILPSGERKSATLGVMTQPVYNFQAMRQKEVSEVIRVALNAHEIRIARLAKIRKSAATAKNPIEIERCKQDAETLVKEINENPVPPLPTFICDDITTEALGVLMSDNGERLNVMSAEGGVFGIMNGRYSDKGSNFDLYLKAHSGDPWSCHRISRDNKTMLSPALTMCLTIQPDVIHEIGMIKSFRGRGLLARFLYSSCKAQAGYRIRQNKEIQASLLTRYEEHVHSLMNIDVSEQILKLSPEAQLLWDNFYSDIENEMREGGSLDNLKDWGSKLPGAVARISGLLHMATHGAGGFGTPISAGIVGASCVIGCFYKEHAIATFNMMKTDPRIEAAKLILEYISRHKPEHFKGHDVLANKNAFKTMADVIPGLKILLERGYIRERETISLGVGRPEAISYIVNPKLYENHQ